MTTVLLVEDEKNQRLLYEQELTEDGYDVVLAADGREALERVGEARPDIVVLDIAMPNMDGIETLGKLLSRDNTIPVILHTAYSSYKGNFMTWSADAYVVKSSDLSDLKAKIREALPEVFRDAAFLLVPGAAGAAPRGLERTGDPRFSLLWTYLGCPSLTLPTALNEAGLPLGLQLVGRPGEDARLLAAGARVESLLGFRASPTLV